MHIWNNSNNGYPTFKSCNRINTILGYWANRPVNLSNGIGRERDIVIGGQHRHLIGQYLEIVIG
jgi:hypothetical protein